MTYMEKHTVDSVKLDHGNLMVSIKKVPITATIRSRCTKAMAARNINVDNITQTAPAKGAYDLSFIIGEKDLDALTEVMDELGLEYPELKITINKDVTRLKVYGIGMRTQPGVTAKFLQSMADNDVQILMITTSEISISCIINTTDSQKAELAAKNAFKL